MNPITLESLIPDFIPSITRINSCILVQNCYLKHFDQFKIKTKEEIGHILLPLLQINHLLGKEKTIIYSIPGYSKIKKSLSQIIDQIWEKNQNFLIPVLLKFKS